MSNTHKYPILGVVNSCLVLAGVALMFVGSNETMSAQVPATGPGSLANALPQTAGLRFEQGVLHFAAPAENGGGLLALGMLLVLLGCCAHMLIVLKHEKPIPKMGLPKRKIDRNDLGTTRQYLQMFWIVRK